MSGVDKKPYPKGDQKFKLKLVKKQQKEQKKQAKDNAKSKLKRGMAGAKK